MGVKSPIITFDFTSSSSRGWGREGEIRFCGWILTGLSVLVLKSPIISFDFSSRSSRRGRQRGGDQVLWLDTDRAVRTGVEVTHYFIWFLLTFQQEGETERGDQVLWLDTDRAVRTGVEVTHYFIWFLITFQQEGETERGRSRSVAGYWQGCPYWCWSHPLSHLISPPVPAGGGDREGEIRFCGWILTGLSVLVLKSPIISFDFSSRSSRRGRQRGGDQVLWLDTDRAVRTGVEVTHYFIWFLLTFQQEGETERGRSGSVAGYWQGCPYWCWSHPLFHLISPHVPAGGGDREGEIRFCGWILTELSVLVLKSPIIIYIIFVCL